MYNITAQEIFDIVVNGLRKQGKQSINDICECVYREKDNCKCAVRFLIPDDVYQPEMEGKLAVSIIGRYDQLHKLISHDSLLCDLQGIHDSPFFNGMEYWEKRWKSLAKDHGLIYREPETNQG